MPDYEEIQDRREEVDASKHQNKKWRAIAPLGLSLDVDQIVPYTLKTNRTHVASQMAGRKNRTASDRHVGQPFEDKEERIVRLAYGALGDFGYYELTRLTCEYQCHGGVLILRGRVSSFYMKQVAQTVVKVIEQVHEIKNEVVVDYRT